MKLVVVGSVALDSVTTPFGVADEVLGGSATYFSVSASFFAPVGVVAVIGEDYPVAGLELLRSRGVDLEGLTRAEGPTFRWRGRYEYDLNHAQTLETRLNVFESFAPELPESYREAECVFLGNIDPELQSRVLDQVRRPQLVALDTMNLWIGTKREALVKVLARVDLLLINEDESRQLAGEHSVVKAARAIQAMGPRRVMIKRGEYGSLLFDGDHVFAAPAFPLAEVFDPTGAGDTFAGGVMGYLARQKERLAPAALRQAIVVGSTMASFTVEKFSLDRLKTLDRAQIKERIEAYKRLTHFEELHEDAL